MINVLIIDNSPHVTGAFKSIINATSGMEECKFIFVTPSRSNRSKLESLGFQTYQVSFTELQRNWKLVLYIPHLIYNFFLLRKLVKKHGVDIVHINDLYNMVGILLKIFTSVKLIYHIRLLKNSYVGSLYAVWSRIIKLFADQIVYVSKAVSKDFGFTHKGIVVYDSISFMEDELISIGKENRDFRFIYPSNFIPGKGHFNALTAFDLVCKRHRNVHLTFVGGTLKKKANEDFRNEFIREIGKKNARDQISIQDFSSDILSEMSSHDAVLMFSESESFSLVCLEGAFARKPVIATDCGGPAEIILNNKTGILVEVGNIEEMQQAMEFLIQNEELGKEMGEEAYEICNTKFSIEEAKMKILNIYRKVC